MLSGGAFPSEGGRATHSWKPIFGAVPTGTPLCQMPFPARIHSMRAEATWSSLDILSHAGAPKPAALTTSRRRPILRPAVLALCASLVVAVMGSYLFIPRAEKYQTTIGEVRRVPLADRSTMAINTGSKIQVAYASKQRAVAIDQGEAWFQVAKDKKPPLYRVRKPCAGRGGRHRFLRASTGAWSGCDGDRGCGEGVGGGC